MLPTLLCHIVEATRRHAGRTIAAACVLFVLAGWASLTRLHVSTDTDQLFRSSLPWRQREIALTRAFPSQDGLVAVISARIPEEADATAAALAARLAADPVHFRAVSRPDANPFLQRNGLLFLDKPQLTDLLGALISAQPFLGQLTADPSARGLLSALSLIALGVQHGQADLGSYQEALGGLARVFEQSAQGTAQPLSWQNLLAGKLAAEAGRYRFVLIDPRQDFGALEPGGAATAALRKAAASLPYLMNGDATLGITGQVALADEEFATVAQGVVWGTLGSVLLISLWLFLAVGTWRLIVPILLTLLLGLILTTGFAALAVGTINLVSVAFAILFVGIAVDFAIQFSVRFREARSQTEMASAAFAQTARRAGGQILVAAMATAAGFYAFVPTSFAGVAELGLIAGTGMLIAFACTIGFLPAAIACFDPPAGTREPGLPGGDRLEAGLTRFRWVIMPCFVGLAVLGMALLPRLRFDSDPLHTKDPHTESMRVLASLMNDPATNPYTIDILTPSLAAAAQIQSRLAPLPLVASSLSLESFVPQDQAAKLALIADTASILAPTLAPPATPPVPPGAAELRLAIHAAAAQLSAALPKLPPGSPLRSIATSLERLQSAPDPSLRAMNDALTRFLPTELDQLRGVLGATRVSIADIPPDLARQWVLPDGRARVNVAPKPAAQDSAGLHDFVAEVRRVAPNAGGAAVTIIDSARTIIQAFESAVIGALGAICVLLAMFLRRPRDVLLVVAPLLLAALLTVVILVVTRLPLNFANIIALPLLLGVGVSFNIYFVMNWRAGATRFLGSATARAVLFSAFTTGTAFGSLALSHHPGTASMGALLLISLGATLAATLLFMPALLTRLDP